MAHLVVRPESPSAAVLDRGTCDEMPCFSRVRAALRAILANSSWRACIVSDGAQIDNAAITRRSRVDAHGKTRLTDDSFTMLYGKIVLQGAGQLLAKDIEVGYRVHRQGRQTLLLDSFLQLR